MPPWCIIRLLSRGRERKGGERMGKKGRKWEESGKEAYEGRKREKEG